eukprot:12804533-Ditylum_brightwellii.AAC.1
MSMNNNSFLNCMGSINPGGSGSVINNNGGSMSSLFSQSVIPGQNKNERSSNMRDKKGGER